MTLRRFFEADLVEFHPGKLAGLGRTDPQLVRAVFRLGQVEVSGLLEANRLRGFLLQFRV